MNTVEINIRFKIWFMFFLFTSFMFLFCVLPNMGLGGGGGGGGGDWFMQRRDLVSVSVHNTYKEQTCHTSALWIRLVWDQSL